MNYSHDINKVFLECFEFKWFAKVIIVNIMSIAAVELRHILAVLVIIILDFFLFIKLKGLQFPGSNISIEIVNRKS